MNNIEKFLFFCAGLLVFFVFFVIAHESAHQIFFLHKGVSSEFSFSPVIGFATVPDANQFMALPAQDRSDLFLANSFNEAIAYNVFPIGASIFAVLLFGVLNRE